MQLSILLLAADRVAADALSAALAVPGHGVSAVTRLDEAAAAAGRHSLVVIDRLPAGTTAGEAIAALRSAQGAGHVPILAVAQSDDIEERISLIEAGADEIITRPFDQLELEARVEAVSLRFQRSGGAGPHAIGDSRGRRLVTVFSPKGGVGTTTIAANLGLLAAETNPRAVLLVDLDLSFGQVASHLNLQPKQTLLELIRDEAALREADLFRTYTIHHPGGLQVLAAPPTPGFASLVSGEHVEQVLARAMEAYEIVIVDAGATMDDRLLAILGRSDTVIVPVLPEIPALNAVHLLLDQLAETGSVGGSTLFVLNNTFARELLRRSDVESALGAKITAELPYDAIAYLKAVNEGVPVIRSAPKSPPAEKLRALAGLVFGPVGSAVGRGPDDGERRGGRRLFGRRR